MIFAWFRRRREAQWDMARVARELYHIAGTQQLILKEIRMAQEDINKMREQVERATTVSQSVLALVADLAQRLRDAADDPEEIRALATQLENNNTALAEAVAANTPAARA